MLIAASVARASCRSAASEAWAVQARRTRRFRRRHAFQPTGWAGRAQLRRNSSPSSINSAPLPHFPDPASVSLIMDDSQASDVENTQPHGPGARTRPPFPVELQLRVLELALASSFCDVEARTRLLLIFTRVAREVGKDAQRLLWRDMRLTTVRQLEAVLSLPVLRRAALALSVRALAFRLPASANIGALLHELLVSCTNIEELGIEGAHDLLLAYFRSPACGRLKRVDLRRCEFVRPRLNRLSTLGPVRAASLTHLTIYECSDSWQHLLYKLPSLAVLATDSAVLLPPALARQLRALAAPDLLRHPLEAAAPPLPRCLVALEPPAPFPFLATPFCQWQTRYCPQLRALVVHRHPDFAGDLLGTVRAMARLEEVWLPQGATYDRVAQAGGFAGSTVALRPMAAETSFADHGAELTRAAVADFVALADGAITADAEHAASGAPPAI